MAHGHEDYGPGAPVSTVYAVLDMAELAARLGSIDTFDRRGNVIWMDDFESGINKWLFAGSSGYTAEWSALVSEFSGFSLYLKTPASASAYVSAYKLLPYPALSKLGFELRICNEANWDTLRVVLVRYDGSQAHTARIDYDEATNKFYYYGSDGSLHDAGLTHKLSPLGYLFHVIKLVIDPTENEYVRLIVDNDTVDLSGIDVYTTANVGNPCLSGEVYIFNTNSDVAEAYIDAAIFTQNEP